MATIAKPNTEVIRQATLKAFQGKLDNYHIESLLELQKSEESSVITATGSLYFALFYGVISCNPSDYPYEFEESSWGLGGSAISSAGVMYTAYESWDNFFHMTTGYHAQGIADAGGLFQITFFNGLSPIGQFNAVSGGIGVFEVGGNGKWKKK